MKKKIIALFIFILVFSHLLFGEKTIAQQIAQMEKTLLTLSGEKKVDHLVKIGYQYISLSAHKVLQYGTQALELAQELRYHKGEGDAYNLIAIGSSILGNPERGRECFQKALDIFKKINDKKGLSKTLNNAGVLYRRTGEYYKAMEYFQETLKMEKELGNNENIANILLNLGNLYHDASDYDKALDYYLQNIKLLEELGKKSESLGTLQNIGNLYLEMEKPQKALEYFQSALQQNQKTGNLYNINNNYQSMGICYQDLDNNPLALEYFQKALKLSEQLGDKRGMSYSLGSIGSVHQATQEYKQAMEYYYRSLKIAEEIDAKKHKALTLLGIGYCCTQLRDYKESRKLLEQALKIGEEIKVKGILKQSYEELYRLYAAQGNDKKALEYFKLFHQTDTEILDQNSNIQINELREKYEAEERSREIQALKKNNEIQQLKLSKERITKYALIIGIFLVLIIFALLFKKYLYLFSFWKKQKYIGQFRLMEKLGSGAMGTIYKAHNLMDRTNIAAVKILREDLSNDINNQKRFKREAAIIDKLKHPHIIQLFEIGFSKENLFIAMEFLEGKTLEEKIKKECQLSIRDSIHIMEQVSDAIAFIHNKSIIHRDLKPANIMIIETEDDSNFVKLLDFGLAKMELESRLTQSGNFLGTLEYVAPEQILDAHSIPANDIFSMGVIFYYMLSGKRPFTGGTAIEVMRKIIMKEPVRVSEFRPDTPGVLNNLVMSMIDKQEIRRPPAESIRNTLRDLISDGIGN